MNHDDYSNIADDAKIHRLLITSVKVSKYIAFMRVLYKYKDVLEVIGERVAIYK